MPSQVRRRSRSLAAVAMFALIVAMTASASVVDPKRYVLTAGDLPSDAHLVAKRYVSAKQRAKGIAAFAAYVTHYSKASAAMYPLVLKAFIVGGYETGCDVLYVDGRLTNPWNGALLIKSGVSEFPTADSANTVSWFYNGFYTELGFKPFAFGPRIAGQAHLWSVGGTIRGMKIEEYTIIWQEGRFVASVDVEGKVGQATAKEAIRLARVLDKRMKQQ